MCVAIGVFPVTGVTLPLISYGGSSFIATTTMLGILLNISRYNNKRLHELKEKEHNEKTNTAI
jgi:cell division protein FtsW